MIKEIKRLIIIFPLILLSVNGFCQIIDSVVYKPFNNVDSIEYWHKPENKDEKSYIIYGYTQYCNCDYYNFLKESNFKSQDSIPTSEGFLDNGIKNGKWTYWNNVKGICCDEFHLYPDSTVIYEKGLKIEKTDRLGYYHYFGDQIRIEIVANSKYPYAVECNKDSCEIVYCDKFILKKFDMEYLDLELERVASGEYNFEAKKASDNLREKQENMKNNR